MRSYGQAGDLGQRGWRRGGSEREQRRVWPLFCKTSIMSNDNRRGYGSPDVQLTYKIHFH